ncbi:hypothetical protein [Aurantivibrio plasticivorans]
MNETTHNEQTIIGKFKFGFSVEGVLETEYEIAPITNMGQLFAAEVEADPKKPLQFQAALIAQQLKRIGNFEGPFTLGLMRRLRVEDFNELREAQRQLEEREELGNDQTSD